MAVDTVTGAVTFTDVDLTTARRQRGDFRDDPFPITMQTVTTSPRR